MIRRSRAKKGAPEAGSDAASPEATEPGPEPVAPPRDATPAEPVAAAGPETAQPVPLSSVLTTGPEPQRRATSRFSISNLGPVLLLRAAHPRQAFLTAVGVAAAAALAGRKLSSRMRQSASEICESPS